MSGPWDRPPSPGSDDTAWPSEDLEARASGAPSPEPWSADDPWQESRSEPESGWGEWSASPPSPAEYAVDEVDRPSSDPWSETWTDDDPILDQPPAVDDAPPVEPIVDDAPPIEPIVDEPAMPEPIVNEAPPIEPIVDEPEPPSSTTGDEPERVWEPIPREPERVWEPIPREPERVWEPIPREPERVWEPVPESADGIEPAGEPPAPEPVAEPAWEPAPPPASEATPEPEGADTGEAVATTEAGVPEPVFGAFTRATDAWVPAPVAEPWAADDGVGLPLSEEDRVTPAIEPDRAEADGWVTAESAELEAETWGAPHTDATVDEEAAPDNAEPSAEEVTEPDSAEPDLPVAAVDGAAATPAPDWLPEPLPESWAAAAPAEPAPAEPAPAEPAPAEPEVDADPPTPIVEPSVARPAEWWDTEEPEPAADVASADAVEDGATASWREPDAGPPIPTEAPMVGVAWDADAEVSAASIEAEREVDAGASAEPEPAVDEAGTDVGDEEPPNPFPFLDGTWPRGDATEVLPTTWEPSPPAPKKPFIDLDPSTGSVRTSIARREPADAAAEEPTTAEQAVPWLIGIILLLAGMVIVLLALIFAGDASLGGLGGGPSESALAGAPDASASSSPVPSSPRPSATPVPAGSVAPTPTRAAAPEFGPLEMVYQGRAAALAPIYLLRHDFTTEEDPQVMAQDPALDVRRLAWAPDGSIGAGLLADVLVSIEPGQEKRRLGDGITTITFGDAGDVVYAVRITQDGGNDVAHVLAIDFLSGDTNELASISYARPEIGEEPALSEAQFSDDGGTVRLFWMHDDTLRLWALGGGTWQVDPGSGDVLDQEEALPILWSPDGRRRIAMEFGDGATLIRLTNHSNDALAETTLTGRVSHLRWSRDGERIVFTLGRSAAGGGVLQDLFLWDLDDGVAPMQLTSTGAAFGAEWLGTTPRWEAG